MNFDEEDTLLLVLIVCICQAAFLCQLPFKKPKNRKTWVKDLLRRRETSRAYNNKVSELQFQDRYNNNSFWFAYFTFFNLYP